MSERELRPALKSRQVNDVKGQIRPLTYIVGCRGVVQLGGLIPVYPWEAQLKLRLVSLFYSLKVPLKLK